MKITVDILEEKLDRFKEIGETPWTLITEEEKREWSNLGMMIALKVFWALKELDRR